LKSSARSYPPLSTSGLKNLLGLVIQIAKAIGLDPIGDD
jgi:hypothetical protein